MTTEKFIEEYLLNEVKRIEAANVRLHLFVAMQHGIETAGALLDNKPFKAKGLGRTRFNLALSRLFPNQYIEAGQKLDLYGQLRNHSAHCLIPAKTINLNADQNEHLIFTDGRLPISLKVFFYDYTEAMKHLKNLAANGLLKEKQLLI